MEILAIIGILYALYRIIKEACEPEAPTIDNFELYRKDIISGVDHKTLYKNQLNGRYSKPKNNTKK